MNLEKFRRYEQLKAGVMKAQQPQITDRRQFILDRQLEEEKLSDADDATFGAVTVDSLTFTTPAATFVQGYATASATTGAYTPDDESAAYTGIASGVGGTPYAQLTDLNALRTAVENLRALSEDQAQMLNALIDFLQARGWIA